MQLIWELPAPVTRGWDGAHHDLGARFPKATALNPQFPTRKFVCKSKYPGGLPKQEQENPEQDWKVVETCEIEQIWFTQRAIILLFQILFFTKIYFLGKTHWEDITEDFLQLQEHLYQQPPNLAWQWPFTCPALH